MLFRSENKPGEHAVLIFRWGAQHCLFYRSSYCQCCLCTFHFIVEQLEVSVLFVRTQKQQLCMIVLNS